MDSENLKSNCLYFILVIIISGVALIGWIADNLMYAGMGDYIVPMAPSTIVCFLSTSLLACILQKKEKRFSTFSNVLLGLSAFVLAVVWIEIISGYRVDLEGLLVNEEKFSANYPIGRMSPVTSILFAIAIITLFFARIRRLGQLLVWINVFSFLISVTFCIGYLFNAPLLYGKSIIPPAWNTSLSFALLFLGLLSGLAKQKIPVSLFVGETIRARLLRGFLPVTLLIIFLSGWATISFQSYLNDDVLVTTAITIISLLVLMLVILRQAKSIGKEIDSYLSFKSKVQQELNEKEAHFKTLADSGQALIWTCGIDQKCDYFNSPWLIFTGRTLAEELNDGWLEEIHPDDRSYRKQTFDNAFNSRTRFCIDYRLRSANGSYHWVQENGSPRFNFDDEFIGYIGHCMDITQRKENEESLKVSEFRYRELLEKISLVAVILDLKGDIVFCNEQTLKLTGYSLDELIGQNWFDLMLPAESRTVKKVFIEGIRTGKVEERFENPIITKSGKKRDIKWSNVIQRNSNNEITGIAGVGEDITEQRKAEAAIKNKDHLIFRTGKMAKVGGWEFEVKTGKGSWTDEVASIHGLDPNIETNSSIGLSFYEEEYRKKIEEAIEKAVTEQKPYDLELKMTDAKGNQKWVRTIGIPVVAEGITVKLQGTFQDITELKKTEDSLQKLNIELEQRVQSRTTELEQKNADLERMNKLFVGRELRMIELKNQIDELKSMLEKK